MPELLFKDEVYAIDGAAMESYRETGCGFSGSAYQACLEIELAGGPVPFFAQKELPVFYLGRPTNTTHFTDLVAGNKIIIEIKSPDRLSSPGEEQINYDRKVSRMPVGGLVNLGAPNLEWKRPVLTEHFHEGKNSCQFAD